MKLGLFMPRGCLGSPLVQPPSVGAVGGVLGVDEGAFVAHPGTRAKVFNGEMPNTVKKRNESRLGESNPDLRTHPGRMFLSW